MNGRDHEGRASNPSRRARHSVSSNEEGLRALGDRMALGTADAAPSQTASVPLDKQATSGNRGYQPVANEAGLNALAEQIPPSTRRSRRQHASRRSTRHRWRRRVVIGLVALLVVIGGGAGYVYYETHDLNRTEVRGLNGALTSGAEAGSENILMVGSTSRCALTHQNLAYGLCSQGVNGVNSDVIMILHADPVHHRLALLSIPRDLFIPNARSTGPNKVDAGLFQGLTQLVGAIEEDFGIPIQHAVSLNFDQFANIVDALGGINMSFPISVFDAESGLNVQAATCVHLNGTQALEVVRARHLQYDSGTTSRYAEDWPQENQSDLARIRRDHEFLRVLGTAVAKEGLGNPLTDLNLINSVKSDLTFDQSWSVDNMASLVLDFHSVGVNSVPQLTLPVAVVTDPDGAGGSYMYQGGSYGDVEFPSQSQDQATIDEVLGVGATTDTMTGNPLPAPSTVTVSVMNGSGAYDQAADTSAALAALGFHTVGVGDTSPVGDVSETVVYFGSHASSVEAAAESVARSMSGAVVMAYDPAHVTDGAQVTVVTGTQFAVNPPAATSVSPSTSAGATVPTTTTTAPSGASGASGAIATPNAATAGLEPWDPRACPAGATPTVPAENPT